MQKALDHLKTQMSRLSPISESEWNHISSLWKWQMVEKNQFVTKIGQTEGYFYFVHEGVLRAYMLNDGVDVSIGFSYHGDFSGAYDSFLNQNPSDWAVQALTNVELLKISYPDLMALFDQYKSMERWGRLFNEQILIGLGRRQVEVRSYSAEDRFERLFDQSPHIFQLVSQKHLASYLGMTPETFSRLRKQKMKTL